MTDNTKNNILLAEFSGLTVYTGNIQDRDFEKEMKKHDLCYIHADDTIIFNRGNKAGNKYNPYFNSNQADIILEKVISENVGCVFVIGTPKEKRDRWTFSLGTEIDKRENQHFISSELVGFGSNIKSAKYDFLLKYAKKAKK